MRSNLLSQGADRAYLVVLERGEEVIGALRDFARSRRIRAARLDGAGALSDGVLGFFDWTSRDYHRIPMRGPAQIVTFTGDVVSQDGRSTLHVRVVVGYVDGSVQGGALLEARAGPALEITVVESAEQRLRWTSERERTAWPLRL